MDCNRLPLDNGNNVLYINKHINASKYIQNIYDKEYTVNPKDIIKTVISREQNNLNIKARAAITSKMTHVSSFINEDIIEVKIENNIEDKIEIKIQDKIEEKIDDIIKYKIDDKIEIKDEEPIKTKINENSSIIKDVQTIVPVDAWRFMVGIIDDMSSLYTDNMWRDAIDSMKQKLIVLMTSGTGHKKYGPKKSRTILAWLTDNKRGTPASPETATVIAAFISWLLDVNVSSLETSNTQWYMFRKRGMWMIKYNNV